MSISRVKPSSWALNEKLTSNQINQLDINTTYALDKRSGQSDTLSSDINIEGNLSLNGGSFTVINGSDLTLGNGGILNSLSGSTINLNSGSTTTMSGSIIHASGSTENYNSGSNTVHASGSIDTYSASSNLNLGGFVNFGPGNFTNFNVGSNLNVFSSATFDGYTTFTGSNPTVFGSGGSSNIIFNNNIVSNGQATFFNVASFSNIVASGASKYRLGIRSVNRWIPVRWKQREITESANLEGSWRHTNAETIYLTTDNYVSGHDLYGYIDLPHGATLNSLTVYVRGNALNSLSHGVNEPVSGNRCVFYLSRQNGIDGADVVTSVTDTTTGSAYDLVHAVSMSSLVIPINRNQYSYQLLCQPEQGTKSRGFQISEMVFVSMTITEMDDFVA